METPPSRVWIIAFFALSAIADSLEVANLVPITTASAPNANPARTPLASDIPPAANTGIPGIAEMISGTSDMILAELINP